MGSLSDLICRDHKRGLAVSLAVCFVGALCLAGCDESAPDPKTQIGANPDLPAQQRYLVPPMHVAAVVGWKQGEAPTVADGLQIKAGLTAITARTSIRGCSRSALIWWQRRLRRIMP